MKKLQNARLLERLYDKSFIEKLMNDESFPDKDNILEYLCSGEWCGQECSVWNSEFGESEPVSLWTDGEWVWDERLIDYIRDKNFKITDFSFLQHIKDNNWKVPEIDFENLKNWEF